MEFTRRVTIDGERWVELPGRCSNVLVAFSTCSAWRGARREEGNLEARFEIYRCSAEGRERIYPGEITRMPAGREEAGLVVS